MDLKEIPEKHRRKWLLHWHGILDAELGPDPLFNLKSAFEDPYGDCRMHFATWDLSDEALCRCFEVLPHGAEMAERAIETRSILRADTKPVTADTAVKLFEDALNRFSQFIDAPDLSKPIQVRHISSEELNVEAGYTERIRVLFEDVNWSFSPDHCEASSFLTETLYRLAHSYEVADYVKWPLFTDARSIDPHKPLATLILSGGYYPVLDEDGPVLFAVTG